MSVAGGGDERPGGGPADERPEELAPRIDLRHLGRRLLVPAVLALAALLGLALVADARELADAVRGFDARLLAPVLALSLVNYLLRLARWQLYLKRVGVRLSFGDSVAVFLTGFLLSVTPGKAGELGKAWLVKALGGGVARRPVAVVLAERINDLLSMLVLTGLGALAFPGGGWVALSLLAGALLAVSVLLWRRAALAVLGAAHRLPLVHRMADTLVDVYDLLRGLLRPPWLAAGLALAIPAWGAEAIGFVLVVGSYQGDAGLLEGVFNYSASTLLGALSLVPGGLLVSEGALTALLNLQGLATPAAASATLIIRAATLWFAVALGVVALPFVLRRLRAERGAAQGSRGG
ncbi:MAG: lysylphosphatidylglycerol synthase transmembrane domain-containing protein [Thermoanaerobaculia bacterium]|nr:lysylphosphatidylglycerol synthase transmembrane domain-containing protein [Thermoanaerobaculia bacterium]